MNNFTITANKFLDRDTEAYYHADYRGGGRWSEDGTIENIICMLKNDIEPLPGPVVLKKSAERLSSILSADLPRILEAVNLNALTVCVVPRAKANHPPEQLLFKTTVRNVITQLSGFVGGTDYIVRHTDTRTTHRNWSGHGGSGKMPYPGITKATCTIASEVAGKDILLIDDVYTKGVNIDEDAIQALLENKAKSVTFYAVGKTVRR